MRLDRRVVLALITIVVLVLAAWLFWPRDPAAQADATFARIKAAIERSDANGVVSELHPAYPYGQLWPAYFENSELKAALGGDDDEGPRRMAKRGLAAMFFQRGENHLRMAYEIHSAIAQDGVVTVDVTLEVGADNGAGQVVSPLTHHRFVLAPSGWFSGLKVRGHDKIDISL